MPLKLGHIIVSFKSRFSTSGISKLNQIEPMGGQARAFTVTNRLVLVIAVPMTLAYLTTPLLGIVATAVVGQMGDAARRATSVR